MNTKHTPGPWKICFDGQIDGPDGRKICAFDWDSYKSFNEGNNAANARLIAAAPMLLEIASNFEITGPDDDGLVWLVLHGNGTTKKAMFNLGKADMMAVQVALHLEEDRRAAIAKATGSAE